MSQYFPKLYRSFGENINVKVDPSNYATKTNLKNVTHVDTSSFELKTNLKVSQFNVDKLDIDKLVPVPVDLSKFSDVDKNDVAKKAVYDKLVGKVNNIVTNDFVSKTKYNADKTELEKKIPNVTDFVKKAKLTELENKIPDVSSLATKTALTAVENKIPSVSSLVKKTDYDTKISELEKKLTDHNHDKYITTPEFNTLAVYVFNLRFAQANLITKTGFDAKLSSLNRKITSHKSKHLLDDELKRLKTFDSSYFIGKSHFEDYLVFQQMNLYFNQVSGVGSDNYIYTLKTKALSNENIAAPATKDYKLNPELSFFGTKTKVEFNESCLKQVTFNHGKIVNIYIVYEISKNINISSSQSV